MTLPQQHRGISSREEWANAATMLTPSVVLVLLLLFQTRSSPQQKQLLGCTLLHLPVGVGYHAWAAAAALRGTGTTATESFMCKLDQTVQHLVGIVLSFVLSSQDIQFTGTSLLLNLYWAAQIWRGRNQGRRWVFVGCSVFLYTLPMLVLRRSLFNYAVATLSMALGGVAAFLPGWKFCGGHAVFHLLLGVHAAALWRELA